MIGRAGPVPRQLDFENLYVFPHTGYDSQFYHHLAHDPWLRRDFRKSFDTPRLRWRRILVPACAWMLACGSDRWIDPAYLAVMLALYFLGAWWMARYLESVGLPAWWGLAYLLLPTSLITLERLVVDLPLVTLCLGFLVYTRERAPGKLYVLLAAAILARETGIMLLVAWLVVLVGERKFREALLYVTAAIPAAAWFLYVDWMTTPVVMAGWSLTYPLARIFEAYGLFFAHPPTNPIDRFALGLDFLALAGSLLAVVFGLSSFRRLRDPAEAATAAFAFMGLIVVSVSDVAGFTDIWGHARLLGPLTALLVCVGLARRRWLFLAPAVFHSLRVGVTLAVKASAGIRALFG